MSSPRTSLSHLFSRGQRLAGMIATAVLSAQVVLMVALSVIDVIARRKRKIRKFPTVPPKPIPLGEDMVTIYTFGRDLYADMLASIEGAERYVYFETYIWKGDEVGQAFKDALVAAAARGVDVFVAYDVFANLVVDRRFFDLPDSIHLRRHPLIGSILPLPRNMGRNHRKLWSSTATTPTLVATTSAPCTPTGGATPTPASRARRRPRSRTPSSTTGT